MTESKFPASRWQKCLVVGAQIRVVGIEARALVHEMGEAHGLRGEALSRLGETAIGALFLASTLKQDQRINLRVEGVQDMRRIAIVDADHEGRVRGYLIQRKLDQLANAPKISPIHNLGPWGEGLLTVLRTALMGADGSAEGPPYSGTVPLLTGYFPKDLTFYWHQSEQVPSALGIHVKTDPRNSGSLVAAGGFLVQGLPGADPEDLKWAQDRIESLSDFSSLVSEQQSPLEVLATLFHDRELSILEERELKFFCHCSHAKVEQAIRFLSLEELNSALEEDGKLEVRCDFCNKVYLLGEEAIRTAMESLSPKK